MDVGLLLVINCFVLLAFLVILIIVWAVKPSEHGEMREEDEWDVEKDVRTIKNQIENEAKEEAEEELMPYKPPRLDKPSKKRL